MRLPGIAPETDAFARRVVRGTCAVLLAGLLASLPAGGRPGEPLFRFIFCSDLHISTPAQSRGFARVVDQWIEDSLCYDFIVIGGDISNNGTASEFALVKKELDRTKKPCFVLPGSHDVSGSGPDASGTFRKVFGLQQTNRISHHGDYTLLFLDLTNGNSQSVSVPAATLRWAQQSLPRLGKNEPIIMFSHFSLHPDVPQFPVSGAGELLDILDTLKLVACFSGNYHGLWHGIRNKAHYYNSTCLSDTAVNNDGTSIEGFLWTSVFPDSVHVDFVEGGGLLPLSKPCR